MKIFFINFFDLPQKIHFQNVSILLTSIDKQNLKIKATIWILFSADGRNGHNKFNCANFNFMCKPTIVFKLSSFEHVQDGIGMT
jgi:hypothetical protein